jgi:sugar lactone lactonase YvrE
MDAMANDGAMPVNDPTGATAAQATLELVVNVRASLGEGPIWDAVRGVLWWVDILAGGHAPARRVPHPRAQRGPRDPRSRCPAAGVSQGILLASSPGGMGWIDQAPELRPRDWWPPLGHPH